MKLIIILLQIKDYRERNRDQGNQMSGHRVLQFPPNAAAVTRYRASLYDLGEIVVDAAGSPACGWTAALCSLMCERTRSIVESVMFAPARSLPTNLPSFTARRPNVVSAIFLVLRKSSISERSWAWVSMQDTVMGRVPRVNGNVGRVPENKWDVSPFPC